MARQLYQIESAVDLGRQGDCGACEELVEEDGHGVEPVHRHWFGAVGYAFIVVAFAEVPEADLVEVVQAEGAREGVDEGYVGWGGGGDYA